MNTTIQLSPLSRLKLAAERAIKSDEFGNIWVWTIIVSGLGVPVSGLVGLIAWVVVAVALVFTGGFPQVNLVGYLFAGTTILLGVFNAAVAPLVWGANRTDPEQPKIDLTLQLSLVALSATAFGVYLIFTGDLISSYAAALTIPIVNLVLFLIDLWSWFWQK